MAADELDHAVRLAAFHFLDEQRRIHGEVLPRRVLESGFLFEGTQVRLVGPQGIWKPALLPEFPLTITTVFEGPYADEIDSDDLVRYKYCTRDPQRWDNVALRRAMQQNVPLIYLHGVGGGDYFVSWPVFIVGDDPDTLTFTVAVDEARRVSFEPATAGLADAGGRRSYMTRLTKQRLHQQRFRARVLHAYGQRCAICLLRHRQLLEAAHIIPDTDPRGVATIPNGLALCRLHHGAFDANILGIRPDLVIELRRDILDEEDGPMLVHGLQGFQGGTILVPRPAEQRPKREFLEARYVTFKEAG